MLDSITVEEICIDQWKAFADVHAKYTDEDDLVWINDYVEASYMASLTDNIEAYMVYDYAQCINLDVLDDPSSWATTFLEDHPVFLIYTDEEKMTVAAEAADKID